MDTYTQDINKMKRKKMSVSKTNYIHNLPLINSQVYPKGLDYVLGKMIYHGFDKAINIIKPDFVHELPEDLRFNPYVDSKVYGCMHYGIMISDLPEPFKFLACASIIGNSGFRVFDIDHASRKYGPLGMVTLAHGTAVSTHNGFSSHDVHQEFKYKDDGSLLKFGDRAEVSGSYPNYRLQSQDQDCVIDLELTATGEITWFAKSKTYDHLSLLTRYKGTIIYQGETHNVFGLCTYEYARGVSVYDIVNKPLPFEYKLPFEFFSYQVMNLDKDTQLVMAYCQAVGYPTLTGGYLRRANQSSKGIQGTVIFEVLEVDPEPKVDPDGIEMLVPRRFRWVFRDKDQGIDLEVNATVDCNWLYGLGRGYISGYAWQGFDHGKETQGRGYIEYVDTRFGKSE